MPLGTSNAILMDMENKENNNFITEKDELSHDDEWALNLHLNMVGVASFLGVGLLVLGFVEQWEFWMLPILALGIVVMWMIHIRQLFTERMRTYICAGFLMFEMFYHGVHAPGIFDVSIVSAVVMITLAQTERKHFLDYAFVEYVVIMGIQIGMGIVEGILVADVSEITRIALHFVMGVLVFRVSRLIYNYREGLRKEIDLAKEETDRTNLEMEDFLTNISHEFRTPINAITGLSTLILKQTENDVVRAILYAGERLAGQVENILDYTEVSSRQVLVSERKYMTLPFVVDLVERTRQQFYEKGLEFVVDIDPDMPQTLIGDEENIRKIVMHVFSNAAKFTVVGGVYFRVFAARREYGVNLVIEVVDTGVGMTREEVANLGSGLYQSNRKRDRSTGGIGLGYAVIFGLVHEMEGFVRVHSEIGRGATVRVSIPQRIDVERPCLEVRDAEEKKVAVYILQEKYRTPRLREFIQEMLSNLFGGLHVDMRQVMSVTELTKFCENGEVTHIFTGMEEYMANRMFFDSVCVNTCVAVVANASEDMNMHRSILRIARPITAAAVAKALNADRDGWTESQNAGEEKPDFGGLSTLIVDDEKLNLVVAAGLFEGYHLAIDTAESGEEAIKRFRNKNYDVIFMDHMMPNMDGIEAARRIRKMAKEDGRKVRIIALTANAISGARELFIAEGFDGFIAKPINIQEFERVMGRLFSTTKGGAS